MNMANIYYWNSSQESEKHIYVLPLRIFIPSVKSLKCLNSNSHPLRKYNLLQEYVTYTVFNMPFTVKKALGTLIWG